MEAEVSNKLGAEKNEHRDDRISFFVTERKRSAAALIQVVREAFVQGVSTRKMDKLAKSLGIENLSRSQVSEMLKGLTNRCNRSESIP